ncbi:partner of Y14 and mago [Impatiens glandulifera]|uniref:partner of Y14 and mago n=1 Tax=Impatiens glandulifera TaxID=253017 RepID=UPI001FB08A68|nr:partner of Y14 and mago [Impatiens glandulifera]
MAAASGARGHDGGGGGGGGEDEVKQMTADLRKTLKEGERIIAPTRRPDGTMRKPRKVKAGYNPQDEVARYQSKGALLKKEMEASIEVGPPGYDPSDDSKPKTKSSRRNDKKKEKRLQAAINKDKKTEEGNGETESVEEITLQVSELAVTTNCSTKCSGTSEPVQDIDKTIRALKKKIRLTEAQQQKTMAEDMNPEQLEKVAKLEQWRKELKLLEEKKIGGGVMN